MIRAEWNTPPDGDFARYVDGLMAQADRARGKGSARPVEGFEDAPGEARAPSVGATSTTSTTSSISAISAPGAATGRIGPREALAAAVARHRSMRVPGAQDPSRDRVPAGGAVGSIQGFTLAKVLAGVWLLVLVTLLGVGASAGAIFGAVALGLWAARGLRRWALPPGFDSWSQWLAHKAKGAAAGPRIPASHHSSSSRENRQ